jgi:hypothetical protein
MKGKVCIHIEGKRAMMGGMRDMRNAAYATTPLYEHSHTARFTTPDLGPIHFEALHAQMHALGPLGLRGLLKRWY